jgi:hypothetical protein
MKMSTAVIWGWWDYRLSLSPSFQFPLFADIEERAHVIFTIRKTQWSHVLSPCPPVSPLSFIPADSFLSPVKSYRSQPCHKLLYTLVSLLCINIWYSQPNCKLHESGGTFYTSSPHCPTLCTVQAYLKEWVSAVISPYQWGIGPRTPVEKNNPRILKTLMQNGIYLHRIYAHPPVHLKLSNWHTHVIGIHVTLYCLGNDD